MMSTATLQGPYVFISYPRFEEVFVRRLEQDLRVSGLQVWRDESNIIPGSPDWEGAVRDAISHAYAVVLVASPSVIKSLYIKGELNLARRYHPNRIYPVWVSGTEWADCVPIDFINTQYIDLRGEQYAVGLNALVNALKKAQERASPSQQGTAVYQQGAPSSPSPQLALKSPPRQQPYQGPAQYPQYLHPTPLQESQQVKPFTSPPQPVPKLPVTTKTSVKAVLIAISVLVLAVIVLLLVFARGPTGGADYNATATAQAHNATATAQAQADPYPPAGTLALIDPLSQPSAWNNSSNTNWGSLCQFVNGAYLISQSPPQKLYTCVDKQTYSNFAFEVKMTINQGDCGGLMIRRNIDFQVCQNGSYSFVKYVPNSDTVHLRNSNSSAINQGTNQSNVIAVVANGSSFDLYVNDQKIDSASDNTYSQGLIGLFATALSNQTVVTYQMARVWTI